MQMMMLTCYIGVQDEGKYGEHCVDGGVANHKKALVQRHRREVEHSGEDCLSKKISSSEQFFTRVIPKTCIVVMMSPR